MCLNSANESGSLPFKMFITFPLNEQCLNSASLGVLCKGLLEICIEISSRKNSFWHTLVHYGFSGRLEEILSWLLIFQD